MQKIQVPDQKDGEIIVRRGAAANPQSYPVKDGLVEIEDELVDTFLRAVPGSEIQAGSPSTKKEAKQ